MPSPFPGMDPFLEHPDYFPDLHNSMIILMKGMLMKLLPPPYYATSESREYLTVGRRHVVPDVQIRRGRAKQRPSEAVSQAAVLEPSESVVVHFVRVPHREWYLDVLERRKGKHRLVTSIEILSRSNKIAGSKGRKLYRRKQREVLQAGASLIEIDLLRAGKHTTLVPAEFLAESVAAFDYHVSVCRSASRHEARVYPFLLEGPLPIIDVPLLGKDAPVRLNLQEVLDRCYDGSGYDRQGAYDHRNATPPLTPERLRWAKSLLRRAKLLT